MNKTVIAEYALKYDAPEVEVVEVMVEKGYASSPFLENPEEGDEEGM